MIGAALAADGTTEIFDVYHVDRGYQDFDRRLADLGAEIRREREPSLSSVLS
jgi:UDP-N-acetylglucosamine 1-carboxyvinyltransferase